MNLSELKAKYIDLRNELERVPCELQAVRQDLFRRIFAVNIQIREIERRVLVL